MPTKPPSHSQDSPARYGAVTRWLHWGMAVVLLWQFISAATHLLAEDSPFDEFMWPNHKAVGTLLMTLIVVRIIWAWFNVRHRPPAVTAMARLGHITMYVLMLLIPAIGLIRQYGSAKAFAPFGVPLMPGFEGDKIEWTMELAKYFHSLLAWILLALIVGHIIVSFWHWQTGRKEIIKRIV